MIQNFLAILIKFGSAFLFVLMELVCFYLIVNFNTNQSEIWANSSNIISGSFYERYDNLVSFINLKEENDKLATENARLMRELASLNYESKGIDSTISQHFEFEPALVINNSVNKLNNRITINKGVRDGVTKGLGVITQEGVVGVVVYASDKYAVVNSLLNLQTKVSSIIKRSNTMGDLTWKGKNPSSVSLNSVPQYVSIFLGDTVITSGYSTIFPKGEMIGTIKNFKENPSTGYFDIDVSLEVDMASISQVYVIKNIVFEEIQSFDQESQDE